MNYRFPIVLAVLNARYSHTALGVRYLMANMGPLRSQTILEEFLIQDDLQRVAEVILSHEPRVVALSVSIWNAEPSLKLITLLRLIAPELYIVTGGPELRWASVPPEGSDILIRGDGELVFPEVCRRLLNGENPADIGRVLDGGQPDLNAIELPYDDYSDEDLRQRIIYVESSRGCCFSCEFCLSSRENKVRVFSPDRVLPAFRRLIDRGCLGFKFIDRTFNLEIDAGIRILDFFYEHWPRNEDGSLIGPERTRQAGLGADRGRSFFLHFEVVPDRFHPALIESLSRFPAGGIQLEMGIQTFDPGTGARISRRVDAVETCRNLKLLKEKTGVHIHADLIIGLPGEDENGFADSFNRLRALGPDEIQLGILKLLPGAPIVRHSAEYSMVYNPQPPYDVLRTGCIGFSRMQELKRLARYYDIFANSGKFSGAMAQIMDKRDSPFREFDSFSRWLFLRTGQNHAISQNRQYELVLRYLTEEGGMGSGDAASILIRDYLKEGGERYLPECLRPFFTTGIPVSGPSSS